MHARGSGGIVLGLLVVLLVVPTGDSSVAIAFQGFGSATGTATAAPFTGTTTSSGAGGCVAGMTGVLPAVTAPARGVVYVNESSACPSRRAFVLLPALRFTNALPLTAGHRWVGSLTVTAVTGSTAMLRTVRLFLQQVGGTNPVLSTIDATVRRGAVSIASTSVDPLAASTTYGLGVRMTLTKPPLVTSAQLAVVITFALDDGGVIRAVTEQAVGVTFTY